MNDQNESTGEEKFSDNPEENLRMQNDFLKMKMMAESGAIFGGKNDLPPELENEFLKNIMEFEKVSAESKTSTIFQIVGSPHFEEEEKLEDEAFDIEFERLQELLSSYSIHVQFNRERDDRFKYKFITGELFDHETTFMPVKGMQSFFLYEEFHPDHELKITEITDHFFTDFFERKLDADTFYINSELIEPDGTIVSRQQLIDRFYALYEVAVEFENTSFTLENVEFELNKSEERTQGMGFSEGEVNYGLIFENGERKEIRGPFKIYFTREWDCWGICFFYLAGFNCIAKKKRKNKAKKLFNTNK